MKNAEKRSRSIVVGRNYCNILTMTRALGEAGYEVDVLRVDKNRAKKISLLSNAEPDSYSKYVKRFQKCVMNENQDCIVEHLLKWADPNQKILLMPVDDYTACIIDEALEQLSEYFIVPNVANKTGEISRLMDKNIQKRLAEEFDIPMLKSRLVKSENGQFQIPDDIPYPCFIKPNVSMKSTKSKMTKCNNKKELQEILYKYAQSDDFEMLIEEFADIKAEYSVLGLCTKDMCIAPGVFKVLEGGHRERKGVTITGESVGAEEYQDIIGKCISFIQSLQYTGLFDVDLIETKTGELYFIELNFRAGASMHLFTKTGVNLPALFADYMVKNITVDTQNISCIAGKRFISEKVLLEEFARNDIGVFKMKKYMNESDVFFIKDEQDPKPYKYFRRLYIVAALMKLPYWVRDHRCK